MSAIKEETAVKILQTAGLNKTTGRLALLNVLLEAKYPLTQQEISKKLSKVAPLNHVSIYRSLEAFLKAGVVHKIESGDRSSKFALCGCDNRGHCHPHFICKVCGKAECLNSISIPQLPLIKSGYLVEEKEFYLKGLCADCAS